MNAVAIDRRGRVVAGGAHDHRLHLWHAEDGQLVEQVEVSLGEGPINTIQFWEPPDGEPEVFAGCYSGAVARVGLDGRVRKVLRCHEGAVKALRLLPDRELGLSCAADGSAHAWDLEGRLQARFVGHNAIINDLDAEPGGSLVASVSRDFTVKVYELDGGRLVESIELGRRSLKCVCFFDARNIFIGDYWGHLIHVDLLGGRVRRRRVAFNGISALKRADEELLACSYDGSIYRVDARSLEPTGSLEAMCQRPQPASFSRAGR
jgi:hypothetical protein